MTDEKELKKVAAAHRRATERAETLRFERDTLIREAIEDDGWTHARIAEATGLTRGRINQIKSQHCECGTLGEVHPECVERVKNWKP